MNDSSRASATPSVPPPPALPWWRVGAMWLVLGGPALVVVAGFATLAIALRYGDVPLPRVSTQAAEHAAESMAPATQARNHVVGSVR